MKRCPKCTGLMPDDVTRCIKCGFETGPVRAATPAGERPAPVRPASPVVATSPVVAASPLVKAAVKPAAGAAQAARPGRMGRIRGGLELAKQSWRVLSMDKQLLVFPLLSGVSCVLVLASFFAGVFATGAASKDADETLGWALLFAYYFANYFVIVFFNSALVACAMMRFQGQEPTVRDGLRAAGGCIAQILAWVTLAATVGLLLRFIEQRVEMVGKIVIALMGAAWTIATYFVVPVLVIEKLGPIDTLQRSVALIRNTWGESLVSNTGIGLVSFLAALGILILGGPVVAWLWMTSGSLAVLAVGAATLTSLIVLVMLVSSALHTIVLSALYLYAAEDRVPEVFEGSVQHAFAAR